MVRRAQVAKRAGVLQQMQQRGADARGGLDLLELELVAPRDHRPPDELVGGDDDGDHGERGPRRWRV